MTDYKALYEAQLEENEKLKEGTLLKFQEVEIEDLKEENKKLKDFSNWENHPALKHKVVLDDDYYLAHLHEGELIEPEDYKELQEELKKLREITCCADSEKPLDDYQKVLDYMTGHNDCDVSDVHSDWIIEEIK